MAREPIVVKIGGADGIPLGQICADVAELATDGVDVLLVHGGSSERDALGEQMGVACPVYTSPDRIESRYTTDAGIDILLLALAGRVKPRLLTELGRLGVSAVGLTGLDGGMLRAVPKPVRRVMVDGRPTILRGDRGGRLVSVDVTLPVLLMRHGYVPVVSPPVAAADGAILNVNADRVAAALAVALGARRLVLLTPAPGVLAEATDETSLLPDLDIAATGPLPAYATGGMSLKLIAAREALAGGVEQVIVADGRTTHPLHAALAGSGTTIRLPAVTHA